MILYIALLTLILTNKRKLIRKSAKISSKQRSSVLIFEFMRFFETL